MVGKLKDDGLFANHVIGCRLEKTSFTFSATVEVVTWSCYNFESITAFDNMKLTTIHFIYVKISLLISF